MTPRSVAAAGAPAAAATRTPAVPPSSSVESTTTEPGAMADERVSTALVVLARSTLRRTFT